MHLSHLSVVRQRAKVIPIPIEVIALVTCRSSIPENPVEFTVRPENPEDVSVIQHGICMKLKAYH